MLLLRVGAFGFAFLATALIGRVLGDAVLGQLGLLLAILEIVAGLSGHALDATLVRFAAQKISPEFDGSLPYFQRMFRIKVLVALGVSVSGVFLARPLLAHVIAPSTALGVEPAGVMLAFLGAAALTLLGFVQAWYQAHQRMAHFAIIEFANTSVRLVFVVLLLAALPPPSAQLVLGVYVASSFLVTAEAYSRLPSAVFRKSPDAAISLREPIRFARWVVVAVVCTTLAQRADVFVLGVVGVAGGALGQYVAAFTMARLGDLGIITLFSVLLPRASALESGAAYRRLLIRFVPVAGAALLAGIPVYFAARAAVPLVFGPAFTQAGGLCGILSLGVLASFGAAPAGAVAYGMGRAHAIALLEALKLSGIVLLGAAMARPYGVVGMAWTVTAVRATIGIATYAWAYRMAGRFTAHGESTGDQMP